MELKFELGHIYYDVDYDYLYVCDEQFGKDSITIVHWNEVSQKVMESRSFFAVGDIIPLDCDDITPKESEIDTLRGGYQLEFQDYGCLYPRAIIYIV